MVKVGRFCAVTISGAESEFRSETLVVLLRIGRSFGFSGAYSVTDVTKSKKRQLGYSMDHDPGAYKEFSSFSAVKGGSLKLSSINEILNREKSLFVRMLQFTLIIVN